MTILDDFIGGLVDWEKVSADGTTICSGFGSFQGAEIGERLHLAGDYGVTTSKIQSITVYGEFATIKTLNSTYSLRAWK
jgi:hypothetical protein